MRGKGDWLGEETNQCDFVDETTDFRASCCAERESKEATEAGKLIAVNVYHEQSVGLSLPMAHVRTKSLEDGFQPT